MESGEESSRLMLIGVAMVGEARKEKGGKGGRKQEEWKQ